MGYAENRGSYGRGRYKRAPGRYCTVRDGAGTVIRFRTRREAEQAANDEEAKMRARTWRDPTAEQITFGEYVNRWYDVQDLAASTMQNYRRSIEDHLLPAFESWALVDIGTYRCRATRVRVQLAAVDLGYMRGAVLAELAPHWRRNSFATWLFSPGRHRLVSEEGASANSTGTGARRAVAGHTGPRPQMRPTVPTPAGCRSRPD